MSVYYYFFQLYVSLIRTSKLKGHQLKYLQQLNLDLTEIKCKSKLKWSIILSRYLYTLDLGVKIVLLLKVFPH